jgi:ABC-type multidrug transport system fused ATPase/permease subunit
MLEVDKQKHLYEHVTFNIWDVSVNSIRIVLLFLVGSKIIYWELNYADLVLMLTVIGYLESSLQSITWIYKRTIKNSPTISKLRDFLDTTPISKNLDQGDVFEYKKGEINIKNMSFGYNPDSHVFHNFSLSVKWWTKTALVWESWSGKTTLVKLIAWYLNPDKWEIIIDNQLLSNISLSWYYNHVGYLTQEPSVFDGTIYENLVYALKKTPSDEEISSVIKNAKCEFIFELPEWLNQEIWERWIRLSW